MVRRCAREKLPESLFLVLHLYPHELAIVRADDCNRSSSRHGVARVDQEVDKQVQKVLWGACHLRQFGQRRAYSNALSSVAGDSEAGLGDVHARIPTVHSSSSSANVYPMQKKYGAVEEKLVVHCGLKYLAIGVSAPNGKEPTWLAPGSMTKIPCGESIAVTMNPRARR